MDVTFSRSRTNPDLWNLHGPASVLVEGAVVTVSKRNGSAVRKVVGRVLETTAVGGEQVAVATIHPTLTVAQAEKAAKAAAKGSKGKRAAKAQDDGCQETVDAFDPLGAR